MATSATIGSVAGLWRFPVKSLQGERLDQADLTSRGLVGDRAYALIDAATGKVVSAKSVRLFPDLLGCQAAFIELPQADHEPPPVRITLPDGTTVTSDAAGFVENDWIGGVLAIADTVRLRVTMPDPRCVMTTLAQDDLPKDTEVLRTLTQHNRVQVGAGRFPCAGVYAVVEAPGAMRTGDRVTLT